ncbi:MAG TPA: N-acetylmuramoyl-L-alanine amidase [Thermoanaerobaculia bacterium]|nr:N-acetylmuramoyl-L-alanine amidase [Thermoanaerobaculia bacterium]
MIAARRRWARVLERRRRPAAVWLLAGALLAGALLAGVVAAQVPAPQRVVLGPGLAAADGPGGLVLEAEPLRGEGLLAFAERVCGDRARAEELAGAIGQRQLVVGVRYSVPYACLTPELRRRVIGALFPDGAPTGAGWRYRVPPSSVVPSLWELSERLTGSGENFRAIRDHNELVDESLRGEQVLIVPAGLLRPPLRQLVEGVQAALPPTDELVYGSDRGGSYAGYRLKAGEALYSSVVVRFTGRLFAEEVNALADEIARRSGIADVADIPVGFEVKIPLDLLSPEYLPPGHPGRLEYEAGLTESAQYTNRITARGLDGVTVVLDAGHGGRDVGASTAGVWESLYVYDVMLRVRRILESSTNARVVTTTRDGGSYQIVERDVLPHSQGHAVLVTPPYTIQEGRIGTNLRWYLANDLLARERRGGRDPDQVVFMSIHADSLHPSVRGAMVYVPGLLPIPSDYGMTGPVYASRQEVKNRPRVSFSRTERVRSEGLSRDLAGHLIRGFRAAGLAVHPNQPVRDRIVRGRNSRPWVPAVLRYNAIPAKVLIEICNLANERDRALVRTRAFRERVAQAIVDGLLQYYDGQTPTTRVAAASREE